MYRAATLCFIFVFLLLFSYSIFVGTFNPRSYFLPFLQSQMGQTPVCEIEPPIRVYMYDLPRRFNVGMFNRRSSVETPVTARDWPPWPKNSGLKRQHSVEYWMMSSLVYEGEDGEKRDAVRVSDPGLADAFFVPFFPYLHTSITNERLRTLVIL